jgi:hypothetical protein
MIPGARSKAVRRRSSTTAAREPAQIYRIGFDLDREHVAFKIAAHAQTLHLP